MALKLGVSTALTSCGSWFQGLSTGINQGFLQVISNLWPKGFISCLSAVLQGAAVPYSSSLAAGNVSPIIPFLLLSAEPHIGENHPMRCSSLPPSSTPSRNPGHPLAGGS